MTRLAPYHVLHFFDDEEGSCAFTILVNQTRFHIIADVEKLGGSAASKDPQQPGPLKKYSHLFSNFKAARDGHADNQSRNQSTDSGVDVGEDSTKKDECEADPPPSQDTAERELHEWLLAPLESILRERAESRKEEARRQTLEEWYNCETLFFSLESKQSKLEAVELESTPELQERMSQLRPSLSPVPKYIREINVPWYSSKDLELVQCSESPPPYHPSMVKPTTTTEPASSDDDSNEGDGVSRTTEGRRLFFKMVDNLDPQPTKREIKLLHQIATKGLHDKIRCPQLVGIVTQLRNAKPPPSKSKQGPGSVTIMGFLQTLIPDPTPLTEKFDSDIPQAQRDQWARQAEEMKNVLHENGIIWGDAKGDNFVVDAAGELWIIDFGGSYTKGWVDPEIAETKKGDDMGVEKIVNALHDPENNVARSDDGKEEEEDMCDEGKEAVSGKKRKRGRGDKEKEVEDVKRRKGSKKPSSGADDEVSTKYCYCNGPNAGTMIGCDGKKCKREWFHLECTDLKSLPKEEEAWFCRDCEG